VNHLFTIVFFSCWAYYTCRWRRGRERTGEFHPEQSVHVQSEPSVRRWWVYAWFSKQGLRWRS